MLVTVYRVWNSDNIVKRKLKKCLTVMRQKLTINKKMLSVVSAAGVNAAAGMGGMDRLGGGGSSNSGSSGNSATTVSTTRDHRTQVRRLHATTTTTTNPVNHSATANITINLPPSIEMPDGEEHPFTSARLHIRDAEQESEIYQKCIRPPPNRTVLESESPPPYRSCSAGMLSTSSSSSSSSTSSDWSTSSNPLVVRCHSMSSTSSSKPINHQSNSSHSVTIQKTDFLQRTVKIFTGGGKKTVYQPPPAPTLPVVIVPTVVRSQRIAGKQPPADV